MAPFRVGVRPCGLHWLLWRGAWGPSWFRERSSLTGQGSLRACQPTTQTHTHTQSHSVWLRRLYTKNCWEPHTTLGAIKKIYFTVSVFWLWLLQGAVCLCVSQLSSCVEINVTGKEVWRTHPGLPVYMRTVQPTELTEIQSFQLTCSQNLVKIAAYLQQNCPISLNATCRKGKKNLYLLAARCWPCKLYMTTGPIDSLLFFSVW